MRTYLVALLLSLTACSSDGNNAQGGPDSGPASDAGARADADASPTVDITLEGPITTANGPFIAATGFDLGEVGYEQHEFFISGTASAYSNVGELGTDGKWTVETANEAAYKTRFVVHRPADASRFNGTVIVEWLNVSGGLDAGPDWLMAHVELIRGGYVWVGVSAQLVGVEGGEGIIPGLPATGLKTADPERYGSLSHPGDSFSYDMYSQVGAALRQSGDIDPLGGLTPERIIAAGESQSAFRMVSYINAVHRITGIYDGFLVHSRGGGATPLSQEPEPDINAPGSVIVREDVDVPVFLFQAETDLLLLNSLADRQPDTDRIRTWEVAGTAHADTYTVVNGGTDKGDDPSIANVVEDLGLGCDKPINSGPHHFVLKAAIHALNEWVARGTLPPTAPLLDVQGTPPAFVLDQHGNVTGGVRSPHVDAPVATHSGLGQEGNLLCSLFGTTIPFDATKLSMLYPTHQAYVDAVTASADTAVAGGFLRPADSDLIKAAAQASSIGN